MVDDQDLAGLDPYDLMASGGGTARCVLRAARRRRLGRSRRAARAGARATLLAHLAATEDYNQACLDGTVQQFLADVGAKGAVDLAIRERDRHPRVRRPDARADPRRPGARAAPRTATGSARATVATSTAASARIPARWQAFHLAFELATHADDVGVPVTPSEAAGPQRTGRRASAASRSRS